MSALDAKRGHHTRPWKPTAANDSTCPAEAAQAPTARRRASRSLLARMGHNMTSSRVNEKRLLDIAEQLRDFRRPFGMQLDDIAGTHASEELFDVMIAKA